MCPMVHSDRTDSGDGVYGVPMCPMVHSDGTDSGDGVYGVGHGGMFGQSPCVPWYIQTGRTVGMGYMEWDMGEGLNSPHVSHGTFRRDGQWGWGIWSGTVPMCPMVHSDGTDSGDGVYGVGHGGRFGQSPCVPWYIQTGRTVGMGYMEWDMGEGLNSPHVSHGTFRRDGQWGWGIWSGTVPMCPMVHLDGTDSGDGVYGVGHGGRFGQSPCVPWYIQTGQTVGMGYMEWDMGEGLDSPHVSHGTFRRDGQWGWGIWSGTVPTCPMVHLDGTDSGDGVYGVGHGGRFGQSPCVPWYIQTGWTVGMGYMEWDSPHVSHGTFRRDGQWGWGIWSGTWGKVWTVPMCPMVHSDGTDSGDGVYGVGHGGRFGQSPCVPWYIQTGWTVGMGYMEWDSPHVSHGTFRRDGQWGWGIWSGTWGKVWTVPMPWYIQTGQTVGMGYMEWDMLLCLLHNLYCYLNYK